jgi:hypothetical protein
MRRSLFPALTLVLWVLVGQGCSGDSATMPRHTILSTRSVEFAPVETLNVPTDGSTVTSTLSLENGTAYKLRASGTFHVGVRGDSTGDAEYADFSNVPGSVVDSCGDSSSVVDLGLGVNDAVNDSSKSPRWGPFANDHVYTVDFTGLGAPVGFTFHDCDYSDNTGTLTVEVLAPTVIAIDVDIKPGSDRNPINVGSRGVIPVAILGSADFNVQDVDVSSLAFGVNGAHAEGPGEIEDVNDDGFPDLMLHFRTQAVGVNDGDSELCLSGANWDGVPLKGCDSIVTVPPEKNED